MSHRQETDKLVGQCLVEAGSQLLGQWTQATSPVQNATVNSLPDSPSSPAGIPEMPPLQVGASRLSQPTTNSPSFATGNTPDHSSFRLTAKHQSLFDLWDEWHGVGKYQDDYGGIEGRNKQFGKRWRSHFDASHYSRNKRIVEGIEAYAQKTIGTGAENEKTTGDVLAEWDPLYQAAKCSVASLVTALQRDGKLTKMKQRGSSKK